MQAIGFEHGAVHGGVQLAQALYVIVGLVRSVEAIVGLGHALVAGDHESGAEFISCSPGTLKSRIVEPILRQRKCVKAACGCVPWRVSAPKSRCLKNEPDLMHSRRQETEKIETFIGNDDQLLRKYLPCINERRGILHRNSSDHHHPVHLRNRSIKFTTTALKMPPVRRGM
jgi:hypothetical protein